MAAPFVTARCPLCGGTGAPWLGGHERTLVRCGRCGFAWIPEGVKRAADGRSIYEQATPVFAGDEQADYYRDETAADAARDKLSWVRRFVPRGAALLDVGANFGLFVQAASAELAAMGIEPSPAVVAQARAAGVALETGSIENPDPRFLGRFAAVTLFDVLEHLPEPDRALQRCRDYLEPGGHVFLTTPDFGSPMARLLGRHWYYIDLDEHVALFTRANLRTVLDRNGFRVLDMRTIGRGYRISYIRRRLAFLGRDSLALRAAAMATSVLAPWTDRRVRINLGDVVAVTAQRT